MNAVGGGSAAKLPPPQHHPTQETPTAVVVASKFMPHAVAIQRWLSSMSFRVYTTQDTVGVELGGALKNPLAVGAGMIEGMGLGINTMAALVTRSTKEVSRDGVGTVTPS